MLLSIPTAETRWRTNQTDTKSVPLVGTLLASAALSLPRAVSAGKTLVARDGVVRIEVPRAELIRYRVGPMAAEPREGGFSILVGQARLPQFSVSATIHIPGALRGRAMLMGARAMGSASVPYALRGSGQLQRTRLKGEVIVPPLVARTASVLPAALVQGSVHVPQAARLRGHVARVGMRGTASLRQSVRAGLSLSRFQTTGTAQVLHAISAQGSPSLPRALFTAQAYLRPTITVDGSLRLPHAASGGRLMLEEPVQLEMGGNAFLSRASIAGAASLRIRAGATAHLRQAGLSGRVEVSRPNESSPGRRSAMVGISIGLCN